MPSVRHSASYDSNPEMMILPDRDSLASPNDYDDSSAAPPAGPGGHEIKTADLLYAPPVPPPKSSGMWKRQSYLSVAINSRQQDRGIRQQTVITSPTTTANNQALSSFDSIDTIDTSSTEPRMDQVTTSFESSATDSTTGQPQPQELVQTAATTTSGNGQHHHRMLSSHRGDSGYKSLESSVPAATIAPRLIRPLAAALSEGFLLFKNKFSLWRWI